MEVWIQRENDSRRTKMKRPWAKSLWPNLPNHPSKSRLEVPWLPKHHPTPSRRQKMAYSPPRKTKKLRQPPHLLAKWPFRPYFSRQWPNRRLPQCRKSRQSHCKLPKIVMSKSLRKSKLILWLIMATLKTKKASRPKQSPPKMANPSRKHPKSPNRNPSYPLR